MLKLLTGVAALALAAAVVNAEPGKGKGGDGGGGHDQHSAAAASGGGGQGKSAKADRGGGVQARAESPGKGQGEARRDERTANAAKPDSPRGGHTKANRGNPDRVEVHERRSGDHRDKLRQAGLAGGDDVRARGDRFVWTDLPGRGLISGCPPGLAKKANGCMPPGQLKERSRFAFFDSPDWWGFDDFDGRYAYWDGSLVRIGPSGSVLSWLPLLGGALAPGNVWPSFYEPVAFPDYYRDYYGLGPSYRYYDDVLYRVDPDTMAINSIAALLTGDDFAIGQPMPLGYDVYNVPYAWRDRYADGPDAWYRYSDGYIYEIDPTTRLVAAAIQLLT